ncbi:hypothetical protein Tcan_03210 [Toxocara canis]|uniref:Uncharacterized protein n=1 Tax=Toxocara canis TaxID=6265 RepID=A0A0B2W0M3_TOXCA|nr:hypothetical protein Tcan_03210 [Toxocara canis]
MMKVQNESEHSDQQPYRRTLDDRRANDISRSIANNDSFGKQRSHETMYCLFGSLKCKMMKVQNESEHSDQQPYRRTLDDRRANDISRSIANNDSFGKQRSHETMYCLFGSLKCKTAVVLILVSHLMLCYAAFIMSIPDVGHSSDMLSLGGILLVTFVTAVGFYGVHVSGTFYLGCFLTLQMCIYWLLLGMSLWNLIELVRGTSKEWCSLVSLLVVIYLYAGSISIVGQYFISLKPCDCLASIDEKPSTAIREKVWRVWHHKKSEVITTPQVKVFSPSGECILELSQEMAFSSIALDSPSLFDSYRPNTMH